MAVKNIVPVVILTIASGCGAKFGGDFVFLNTSDIDLEWVAVTGFPLNPPCGILIRRAPAAADMGPMTLPKTATLTWRYKGQPDQQTVLTLPAEAKSASAGELHFEFGSDRKWAVTYKDGT